MKRLRLVSFLIIFFIFNIAFCIQTQAQELIPFKSNSWELYQNAGQIEFIEDQEIKMTSSNYANSTSFALHDFTNSVDSNYEFLFGINYPNITPFGVGFILGNLHPDNQRSITQPYDLSEIVFFQIWQDTTNKFHFRICPDLYNDSLCKVNPTVLSTLDSRNRIINTITSDLIHFRLKKVNNVVTIYIKNISRNAPEDKLTEFTSTRIPKYILLGNYNKTETSVNFSNITLTRISSTPPSSKLILLPGLFGSWNRNAIISNVPAEWDQWQLNPVVHDYDGIINSLKNIGKVENQDFFVFPYDWRKSVVDSATDLNSFITAKVPDSNTKVNLVGHSLGGLVSRTYGQKNNSAKIDKLLTVGSPHSGAAETYKAVAGGDIGSTNGFDWLSKQVILKLYKHNYETDRQTIVSMVPSLLDLLPTYNYLKQKDGSFIPYSGMQVKNNTFIDLNLSFPNLFNQLHTIYGEKGDTTFGYTINARSLKDKLLGAYPDGRPQQTLYDIGDAVIVSNSARAGNNQYLLPNLDHGEIIRTKPGIKKIFDILGLPYSDSQIVEGQASDIKPASLYLLLSSFKKKAKIRYNDQEFTDQDGNLLIPAAKSGHYRLEIIGEGKDPYSLYLLQTANNQEFWESISLKDNRIFEFDFNSQKIKPFLLTQNQPMIVFDDFLDDLYKLSQENSKISAIYKKTLDAKKAYLKHDQSLLKSQLDQIHQNLLSQIGRLSTDKYNRYFEIINKFENLYQSVLTKNIDSLCGVSSCLFDINKIKKMFTNCEKSKKTALLCQEAEAKMNLLTQIDTRSSPLLVQIMNKSIEQLLKLAGSKI
ncbi:hypothetical protein A3J15_00085 [Candidatus Roizmanbacteria bacterium RIFCSPLOWO2_02_FULL_38_10]|uniref:PGAP1 family protein n=1 Tax=Candidatus Roizmanbacteria bacterium RIFCSPLOWO2_02_FULL_38_10 TaxID=1802074 RepID=A0A1F7JL08_9BACT|nr:MAG: hypothetical protein A3J15_00085 [Candidatus Roizmanbacteria bacterium RIFCSPLOWO2_02_FULL_38_10]